MADIGIEWNGMQWKMKKEGKLFSDTTKLGTIVRAILKKVEDVKEWW